MSGVVRAVTSIFKSPDKPSAPPPPPPVISAPPATDNTEAVKEAAKREAEAVKKRKGYSSTFITGPTGLSGSSSGQRNTLG